MAIPHLWYFWRILVPFFLLVMGGRVGRGQEAVAFGQPGFPDSRLEASGQLVEDWGTVRLSLRGEGISAAESGEVQKVLLEGQVPAAQARLAYGSVVLILTAFRGPAWPAGVDVLTARIEETAGQETPVTLSLDLGDRAQIGSRAAVLGGRIVLTLPESPVPHRQEREWGCTGEAIAMPGWAQPEGECDPAFRNIRAGMGGVPIRYRFAMEPKGAVQVVLGLCESYWSAPGQRPLLCKVEGAPRQEVDPLAQWGRHKPGALLFQGRDENGDGWLEVGVLPHPASPDQNPILNVIWLFPPGQPPNLAQVIAGRLNEGALRYVDVGGESDQTLYLPGKVDYPFTLPAHGGRELSFLVACPGGSVPSPERTRWTPESLLRAAREVWEAAK
jgi:hypothetical protein